MLPVCTFLVLAHLGSPGKRAIKRACVCVLPVIMMTVILCTTGFVDDVFLHDGLYAEAVRLENLIQTVRDMFGRVYKALARVGGCFV